MGKQFNNQHIKAERREKFWQGIQDWYLNERPVFDSNKSKQRFKNWMKNARKRADRRTGKLETKNYDRYDNNG